MRPVSALVVLAVLALAGCKDGLLVPEQSGAVQGVVVDFDTGDPVPRAGITTSPATDAITAGADGSFFIEDIPVGTYTVTATRSGYDPSTVTVSVRPSRTAQATVFLRVDEDGNGGTEFRAEVLGFTNEAFTSDSSFVTVEYRTFNTGDRSIGEYEVYFRVDTDRGPFYQEVRGEALAAGQRDIGTFRKRLLGARADSVVIEDVATDGTFRAPPPAR